jgi:hypothetical protein
MDTATSFSNHIKPYFTPCYRAHMIKGFDLWDYDSVKSRYSEIRTRVEDGSMPAPGCGEGEVPEGLPEMEGRKR